MPEHPKVKTQYGIFLSSTNDPEVRSYRLTAKSVIEEDEFKDKWYAVEMDAFSMSSSTSLEECRQKVLGCSIYLGLLGPFYGSINEDVGLSYTEYEYTVAHDAGRTIAIMLLPDSILNTSLPEIIIKQAHTMNRQQDFKKKANDKHTTRSVNNLDEVKSYLRKYLREVELSPLPTDIPTPPKTEEKPFTDTFDRQPAPLAYGLADLESSQISDYLKSPMAQDALDERDLLEATPEEHLRILGLLSPDGRPNLGAFLAFAPSTLIANLLGSASLHMVVYKGLDTKSRQIYKREVEDNLVNLQKRGMQFFRRDAGLERQGQVGGADRDELEIPTIALREALGNALVHRDYSHPDSREQPTRLEVYADRVEIISFGTLVKGVSEELLNTLDRVYSRRRNPTIAKIFMYLQLVEMSGSGILRMRQAMANAGLGNPQIVEDELQNAVKVTLPRYRTAEMVTKYQRGDYIFISYVSEDRAIANEITKRLRANGINIWIDMDNIKAGDYWQTKLEEALLNAGVILVLLSPKSAMSPMVTYEAAYALGRNIPVLPIIIDRTAKIHSMFTALQHIELPDDKERRDGVIERIAEEIKRILGKE